MYQGSLLIRASFVNLAKLELRTFQATRRQEISGFDKSSIIHRASAVRGIVFTEEKQRNGGQEQRNGRQ